VEITLSYELSGTTYSQVFDLLALRGMDEPDAVARHAIVHEYLSGAIEEQIDGFFKRPIVLAFEPPPISRRRFLANWFVAPRKWVSYGDYLSEGATNNNLISEWLEDCELERAFEVELFDEHKYYAWQDAAPSEVELMYCKLEVEITGEPDSPQTFTTGSGGLAMMETGDAWPSFSDTTHVHTVVLTPAKKSDFVPALFNKPSVVGGNVTFQAFISAARAPNPDDGKYYMDVKIFLQEK